MSAGCLDGRLVVVVGAGGVGKTTLAAALALRSAQEGRRTLVMTFDPSLRLKDALGVGEQAKDEAVAVPLAGGGSLDALLLDARRTFDRLIRSYAPDPEAAERIFQNRFYQDLAGNLSGILEYMAMERLFEVQAAGRYDRVVVDTPPTRQAMDFLQAPERMMNLVDSKAVRFALDSFWDGKGRRSLAFRIAAKGALDLADRILGHRFILDVVEFVRAFAPLFDGFRERAEEVRHLLREDGTRFLLVAGPGPDRVPDAMFFLRRLKEAGHHLGPVVVNQVHPECRLAGGGDGARLLEHLAGRDRRGLELLRSLLPASQPILTLPLLPDPPATLPALAEFARKYFSN